MIIAFAFVIVSVVIAKWCYNAAVECMIADFKSCMGIQ